MHLSSNQRSLRRCTALLAAWLPLAAVSSFSSAAAAADAEAARVSLALDLESDAAGLDAAELRQAIERELGVATAAATPESRTVLSVRSQGEHRIVMTFRQPSGRSTTRAIDLPAEPHRAAETAGLLAANLVRDEAAELIAAMVKAAPTPPTPATPPAAAASPPVPPKLPACGRRLGYNYVTFGADLAPSVGSSSYEPPNTVRRFSLEFAGGQSEGLQGVGFSPLLHMTSSFVCGVQFGGVATTVAGPLGGAQLSGLLGFAKGRVSGLQMSGGVSLATDDFEGWQGAGGLTMVLGNFDGAQIAGGAALASGLVQGLQTAPVVVAGGVAGAQIGVVALSAHRVSGLQVSTVNLAGRGLTSAQRKPEPPQTTAAADGADFDAHGTKPAPPEEPEESVRGLQIGVVNVASGTVSGTQIGLVNYAEDSDFSLGIVNVMTKGRLGVEASVSEAGFFNTAIKHGGKHWHNFYGVTYKPANTSWWGFVLGMGGHLTPSSRLYIDIDALAYSLVPEGESVGSSDMNLLAQARAVVGIRPTPLVGVYAGPTYNVHITDRANGPTPFDAPIVYVRQSGSTKVSQWPGLTLGVQVMLGD